MWGQFLEQAAGSPVYSFFCEVLSGCVIHNKMTSEGNELTGSWYQASWPTPYVDCVYQSCTLNCFPDRCWYFKAIFGCIGLGQNTALSIHSRPFTFLWFWTQYTSSVYKLKCTADCLQQCSLMHPQGCCSQTLACSAQGWCCTLAVFCFHQSSWHMSTQTNSYWPERCSLTELQQKSEFKNQTAGPFWCDRYSVPMRMSRWMLKERTRPWKRWPMMLTNMLQRMVNHVRARMRFRWDLFRWQTRPCVAPFVPSRRWRSGCMVTEGEASLSHPNQIQRDLWPFSTKRRCKMITRS